VGGVTKTRGTESGRSKGAGEARSGCGLGDKERVGFGLGRGHRYYRTGIDGGTPAIERVLLLLLDSKDVGIIILLLLDVLDELICPVSQVFSEKPRLTMSILDQSQLGQVVVILSILAVVEVS
jgi:hypothetical protein